MNGETMMVLDDVTTKEEWEAVHKSTL